MTDRDEVAELIRIGSPRLMKPSAVAVLIAVFVLGGCNGGGESSDSSEELTAAEKDSILRAERHVTTYCDQFQEGYTVEGSKGIALQSDYTYAVEQIIDIARDKPDATYERPYFGTGGTMRQYLGDGASDIDQICGPEGAPQSQRLRDAIATLPPGDD
jgi:hypothetical protein